MKIGCAGWGYLPKKFVKPGESRLVAYARLFSVAEVNSTFYALPKTSTARAWRKSVDEVNKTFEFTVKVPKLITHVSRFTDFNTWERIREIAKELRARVLLFQTPRSFQDSEENVKKFVNFFSTIGKDFMYAGEMRGWKRETIQKIFPELGIIHVVDPLKEKPIEQQRNYYRLHGLGRIMYRYRFTDEDLNRLKGIVEKNDYVIFNNIFMYDDAMRFMEMVRE